MSEQAEIAALMRKGSDSVRAAQTLLNDGLAGFAASRAYYAMFYAAEALLLTEGVRSEKHAGVIGEYGRLFAKTGRVGPALHRTLIHAQQLRLLGDYRALSEVPDEQAATAIAHAREFLAAAQDYLTRLESEAVAAPEPNQPQ